MCDSDYCNWGLGHDPKRPDEDPWADVPPPEPKSWPPVPDEPPF